MRKTRQTTSRRRYLRLLTGGVIGGGAVFAWLEGVPSSAVGVDLPGRDPMTETFGLDSVFEKATWSDAGELAVHFVGGHDAVGFTISRKGERPIADNLYAGDAPTGERPVTVDMSRVLRTDARQTYGRGCGGYHGPTRDIDQCDRRTPAIAG